MKHIFLKIFKLRFFEIIICFFSQNKSIKSFFGKIVPVNTSYKPNTLRKVKRKNIQYLLDISDYQNWLIYFGLTEDSPVGLFDLVRNNMIIFDVGSNIGQTAMKFASLGFENIYVYGFEPDTVNFNNAINNLKLNNFKNLFYKNIGLGSENGEFNLKINTPSNRGGNRIVINNDFENTLKVKISKLDDIVKELKNDKVDLIKIDVEGFEMKVLKGAINTLKKHKPILYIELDDNNLKEQNSSAQELVSFLLDIDYKIKNSYTGKIIQSNECFKDCHFDIICL
jgi:FkbM family methyltransferase